MDARVPEAPRSPMPARQYLVTGRVQGVGYRYFALSEAERCRVRGWALNLGDGRVEVHAEADDDESLDLFKASLQVGPFGAQVEALTENHLPVSGSYSSFTIRG